ncbi:hypothetical protein ANTRET_LOCUS6944, partial [Anthophora retusa]
MKLTLFKKFVTSLNPNTDIIDLEKRVQKNESLLENFNDIQTQIEILILDDQYEETYLEERESFENTYYSTIAAAERHIRKFKGSDQPTPIASCSPIVSESQSTSRLPVIKFPTFNGNLGDWIRFRDTFVSLVHNCDKLTDIDRFNYLTSTLTGPASRVIESLGISEINYKIAWTRLKERYENPNALAYYHLNGLLNIVPVKKSDGVALIEFIDTANNHVHALESLMSPTEIWNALINSYLIKLLDFTTTDEWEKRTVDATARPTFHDLSKFIEQRAQYLLRRNISNASASGQFTDRAPKQGNAKIRLYAAHLVNTKHACLLCKGEHALFQCSKLLAMPFSERHETAKLQACFNCLQLGHSISNCTRGTCRKCNKKHHTLLHKDINETSVNLNNDDQNASHSHTLQACVIDRNNPTVEYTVLSTAIIYVLDSNSNSHKCRALLNVGSQAHFITEDFCSRINIPRSETEAMVRGVGKVANPIKFKASLSISSRCNTFKSRLSCLVIRNITEDMPNISLDKKRIPIPPGKPLADPGFQEQGRIDLLIGAGLFWQLLCIGQYKVPESNLVWQKTRFGWVLGGSFNWLGKPERRTCHAVTNANLHKALSRFWEIEETIQPGGLNSTLDDDCEQHFTKTTTRDDKGRYTVSIPFNNKLNELGKSRFSAERRLLNIERKFRRTPDFKEQYMTFMREYENLGHMSLVENDKLNLKPCYYLPHHAVFKASGTTNKIRVVFDGSSPSSTGISLNDAQSVGPQVQGDLFSILIRFRKHKFVVSADIEKMYRQIRVQKSDCKLQRILWRYSDSDPIRTYQLNTVTYGTTSASFLATRTLKQVDIDNAQIHSDVCKIIFNDFYVDDLLTGCETIEQAIRIRVSLTKILEQAGFPLRKWASNNPQISAHRENEIDNRIEFKTADRDPKILDLLWSSQADELHYATKNPSFDKITKRRILSEVAQIFDPLGLLGPIITKAKLFIGRYLE